MKVLDNLDSLVKELKEVNNKEEYVVNFSMIVNEDEDKYCKHEVYLNSIVPVDECMSTICVSCGRLACACSISDDKLFKNASTRLKSDIVVNDVSYNKGDYIGDIIYNLLYGRLQQ